MLFRFYAWMIGGEVVYLQSLPKEVVKAVAHKTPFGLVCLKHGCILKDGGGSPPSKDLGTIEHRVFVSWKR